MNTIEVIVHAIATDGLPDMEKLTGEVAFIFDGCLVSGWPLLPENVDEENTNYDLLKAAHEAGETLWEADSDVGRQILFSSVTHWLEFPEPVHQIEGPKSAPSDWLLAAAKKYWDQGQVS